MFLKIITVFLFLPLLTFAQTLEYVPLIEIDNASSGGIGGYIESLYLLSIGLAALLAVIKITIAGVKWMLSDVVTDKSQAKNDIKGALLGIIIIISGVLMFNIINPNITNINVELNNVVKTESVEVSSRNNFTINDLGEGETATILGDLLFPNPEEITPEYLKSVCENTMPDLCNQTPSIKAACNPGTWHANSSEQGYCVTQDTTNNPVSQSASPEVVQAACEQNGVTCYTNITAGAGGREEISSTAGEVTSFPLVHTLPQTGHNTNVAEMTGWEYVTREIWISTVPGGQRLTDSRCYSSGNSARTIQWTSTPEGNQLRCSLDPNIKYFFNVKQTNCRESQCGFYLSP